MNRVLVSAIGQGFTANLKGLSRVTVPQAEAIAGSKDKRECLSVSPRILRALPSEPLRSCALMKVYIFGKIMKVGH